MWARAAIAFLISTAPAAAQNDTSVSRWLAGPPRADLHWLTHTSPAALSRFQRLSVRLSIRVDGSEIERRRGKDALLFMVELRDSAGRSYEDHHVLDLREAPYNSARHLSYSEWTATAFLVSGDYQATFALADMNTGEHSLTTRKLHVARLSNDPLPGAFRDLPPVEFIQSTDPPDIWFLPETTGRLVLPVASKRPVRVDLLVNTSVSETSRGAQRRPQQSVASLVGALKVLAQLNVPDGRLSVSLFDVSRRRMTFHQESVAALDWPRLKTALGSDNLSTIDVGALKDRDQNIQFFLREIAARIAPAEDNALRVAIVLSPPMAFPAGVDRTPIAAPEGADYRVFYIRYQTFAGRPSYTEPMYPHYSGRLSPMETDRLPSSGVTYPGLPDQLAQTVKPLHPHVFDVFRPIEFRNAIAAILREISAAN